MKRLKWFATQGIVNKKHVLAIVRDYDERGAKKALARSSVKADLDDLAQVTNAKQWQSVRKDIKKRIPRDKERGVVSYNNVRSG